MYISSRAFALAAAIGLSAASAVSAATVDTTISFDEPGIPHAAGSSFTADGYIVSPVNLQAGNCLSGLCTIQSAQTHLPTIIRADGAAFDLTRFWFSMTGRGSPSSNYIRVQAYTGASGAYHLLTTLTLSLRELFSAVPAGVSIAHVAGGAPEPGNAATKLACSYTKICDQYGYEVSLTSGFSNVTKVTFSTLNSANARLDDIGLSHVSTVPLPAPGLMLGMAFGGFRLFRRSRRA